jgi:pyrroline-5-carboxylate reductase
MDMAIEDCKICVLGAGNMGAALIQGALRGGDLNPGMITAADPRPEALVPLNAAGVNTSKLSSAAVKGQDVVVLAVKPQYAPDLLASVGPLITADQLVISMMAGIMTQTIEAQLGEGIPVVRAMPQTLARLGVGAAALCAGAGCSDDHLALAAELFGTVGAAVVVPERLMDAATGLAGSGPAYVYTVIQALTDGGVRAGLPRDVAQRLASQTVLGAAAMVMEGDQHPIALRDQVTSPGGTTAAGLYELEAAAVPAAFNRAVQAATERSRELGST